jgi:hypothetical protein
VVAGLHARVVCTNGNRRKTEIPVASTILILSGIFGNREENRSRAPRADRLCLNARSILGDDSMIAVQQDPADSNLAGRAGEKYWIFV